MPKIQIYALALLTLLASATSFAGNADLCYGPAYNLTGSSAPATNVTIFACPQAGQKTLPQLAAEGWSIVQMVPVVISASQGADQLIIERP